MNATRTLRHSTEMRPENRYRNFHVPITAARHSLSSSGIGKLGGPLQVRVDIGRHHRASDGKSVVWQNKPFLALEDVIEFNKGEAVVFIGRMSGALAKRLGISANVPGVTLVKDTGITREVIQDLLDQARAELAIMDNMGYDVRAIAAKATAIRLTRQLALGEELGADERDGLSLPSASMATHAILFSDSVAFEGLSKLAGVLRISRSKDTYEALRFGVEPKTVRNHAYGRDDTFTLADAAVLKVGRAMNKDVSLPSADEWDDVPTQIVAIPLPPRQDSLTQPPRNSAITREILAVDHGMDQNVKIAEARKTLPPGKAVRTPSHVRTEQEAVIRSMKAIIARRAGARESTAEIDGLDEAFRPDANQPWDPKAHNDKNEGPVIADHEGTKIIPRWGEPAHAVA